MGRSEDKQLIQVFSTHSIIYRELDLLAALIKNAETQLLQKEAEKRKNQLLEFKNQRQTLKELFDKSIQQNKEIFAQQKMARDDAKLQQMNNKDLHLNQALLQQEQDKKLDQANERVISITIIGCCIKRIGDANWIDCDCVEQVVGQIKCGDGYNQQGYDEYQFKIIEIRSYFFKYMFIDCNWFRSDLFGIINYFFMMNQFIPKTLLLLLLFGYALSIPIDDLQNAHQRFQKLQNSGSTGKFWMDLAQLHSSVVGPLDDLKETLSKFYDNLQNGFDELDGSYSQKRALHEKVLQSYQSNQQDAQIDIAQSQDQLDNFLIPNKDNVNKKLQQIKQNIADNRKNVDRDKLEREKQSNINIDNIHQHQLATTAIDEALQLVTGLSNGNIAFSEAPLKKTLGFIKSRIDQREEFAPMIDALIELSGSEDTKKIGDLLNKLRKGIVDSQIQMTSNENDAAKMFDDRSKQLELEFREFQTQVNQSTYDLTSISARIDQEKEFIENRKNDLKMYEDQIQMENSNFASITSLYNDVRSQKLKEIKIVEDAKNFAYSAQFRDLLQSKVNK